MPKYKVTDPDTGKSVTLTGDSPPTESELQEIFTSVHGGTSAPQGEDNATAPSGGWKPTVSKYARPFLEYGGMAVGGLGGGVVGLPEGGVGAIPGAAVGGALGYAGGKKAADALDVALGVKQPETIGGALKSTASAIGEGAMMEAGGAILGKGVGAIGKTIFGKPGPQSPVAALGKKFRIPTSAGEETGNPILQKAETLTEKIPVIGMKGFREAQQVAADTAAKDFISNYIAEPAAADLSSQAGRDLAGRANRDFTSGIYNDVRKMVSKVPEEQAKILSDQSHGVAKGLLERYPDIFKKFQDTRTEGLVKQIVGDTSDKASVIVRPSGKPYMVAPKITFDDMWALRQGLGEKIGQARKALVSGTVDKTELAQLQSLHSAVTKDMETWAEKIGRTDIKDKFKAANEAYKNYTVKYDILTRAYDKAVGSVGAGESFSPKTFSTALKSIAYKSRLTKSFTDKEINEMTGLANIMQVVKRAGQAGENAPTGNRMTEVVGLHLIGLPKTVAATSVVQFLQTAPGKSLARAASKVEPDSPAMNVILNQIYKQIPRAGLVAATQPSEDNQPIDMGE